MKALLFRSKDESLQLTELERPMPRRGELLIQMHYAAFNHLDLWIWKEQILDKPVISGSDGSGIVVEAGPGADRSLIGKEVIINPSLHWGDNEKVYSDKYEVLGEPTDGTFAEFMIIPEGNVYEKPAHLSLEEAAALPLAALTAYRVLFTRAQLTASDKVLITGVGGGVALFLLQIAIAAGAPVYVTSSSEDKIQKAIALGAKEGFNYKDKNWVEKAKETAGGFDVIADSAGGDGFAALTEVANSAARIILFGRTAGNINNLRPGLIFNKHLQISGSLMGSDKEFGAMLEFYSRHQLHPEIDSVFPFKKITEAKTYMESGNHFGKIILTIK